MIKVDANPANADWTKQSWDLPSSITTVEDLRRYLKGVGMTVRHFKRLPVYQMNVGRAEFRWLKDL